MCSACFCSNLRSNISAVVADREGWGDSVLSFYPLVVRSIKTFITFKNNSWLVLPRLKKFSPLFFATEVLARCLLLFFLIPSCKVINSTFLSLYFFHRAACLFVSLCVVQYYDPVCFLWKGTFFTSSSLLLLLLLLGGPSLPLLPLLPGPSSLPRRAPRRTASPAPPGCTGGPRGLEAAPASGRSTGR